MTRSSTDSDRRAAPGHPIGSVGNALEVLKMLKDMPSLRVTEAAQALGVAQSTAHRLLTTLANHGFVTRDAKRRVYVAGPTLIELGLAALQRGGVREQARPIIESLRDHLNETVSIAILDGIEVLVIDAVQPNRLVQVGPRPGHRSQAHWNASGKALLAELDDAELRKRYPNQKLSTATACSIATRQSLLEEIERVRRLGFATQFEEIEAHAGAVGAVIRDLGGQPVAALAVTGLLARIVPHVDELAVDVTRTCAEIGAALSFSS